MGMACINKLKKYVLVLLKKNKDYIPNIMKYLEFDKEVIKDPSRNDNDEYLYKIKNFRGNNGKSYRFYENFTTMIVIYIIILFVKIIMNLE